MKYIISGIKRTTMPKRDGGTWQKTEVKTEQTGEQVLELGRGIEKFVKDGLKRGDTINGYLEKRPWTGRDGSTRFNMVLNGITPEYVYDLLLRINPDVESMVSEPETMVETIETHDDGFGDGSQQSQGDNNGGW